MINRLKMYILVLLLPLSLFSQNDGSIIKTDSISNERSVKIEIDSLLLLVTNMSNTVHFLQQERGASSGYISSNGKKFKLKLKTIGQNSNIAINELLSNLHSNKNLLNRYFSVKEYDKLNTKFDELYILRENVEKLNIDFSKVYSKYTQIIASLLLNISDISDKVEDKELMNLLYSYSTLLMYKESVGQKRAALSGLFSQKEFSKEIFEYYLTSDTQEKIYLKTFLHSVDEKIKEFYFKKLDNRVVLNVKKYERLALDKLNGEVVDVDPLKWFEKVTKKINLIQDVEYKVFDDISILVDKLKNNIFIPLTKEEKEWIKTHTVSVGVEQWSPVIFSNDGTDIDGIVGDYLNRIIKKTGLKIEVVSDVWDTLLSDFKEKKIDLLPATYYTNEYSNYGLYSIGFFKMKDYIYVKESNNNIKSLEDLNKKVLAIEKSFGTIPKIKSKYPDIKILFTNSLDDSITRVLNGKADALYEGQIVVEKKIEDELISGLKGVAQDSFSAPTLHFLSKIDEPILQSILEKGLDSLTINERKKIQEKWLSKVKKIKETKELNIAFHFDRPPYMFGKTSSKGIEADLVKEILGSQGYTVNIHQMAKQNMETLLETNSNFDAVSSVSDTNDGMYYSEHFISYENYVISRKKDNFKIEKLRDLQNIDFVAWKGAYNDLGDEFYKLFNPVNGYFKIKYNDRTSQSDQHKLFFDKKVDAIVVDKTIFEWYKLALKNSDEYTFHKIFPELTTYPAKFRSAKVRDAFNQGLKTMKGSKRYDEIIDFYLKQDIRPLLKYSNLIADISGRFLFSAKPEELKKVAKEFFQHPDIAHIEVFDNATDKIFISLYKKDNKILSSEPEKKYHTLPSIKKDIYFANRGNPLHVGKIEIFYKKDFDNRRAELIPNLNIFADLDKNDFNKVKRSYEKFGLNVKNIKLSKDEREWLDEHNIIRFSGIPNWLPYEDYNENDEHIGIVAEYLSEIEKLLKINFERIQTQSHEETIALTKNNSVDMSTDLVSSGKKDHLLYTQAFINSPIVIIMNNQANYVEDINAIRDKKIAISSGYKYIQDKYRIYKGIDFEYVDSIQEGLMAVSTGKVDAHICNSALGSYYISKMGLSNIKVVGKTKLVIDVGFGIRKDYEPLVSILNKALNAIDESKQQEIYSKWIKQEYIERVDYSLLWKLGVGGLFILAIIIFWNRKMAKEIAKRKEIEDKLKESSTRLTTLFDASPDSIAIIDKYGKYIGCNRATLEIFGLLSKDNFLTLHPSDFSPKFQYGGEVSSELAQKMIDKAFKNGVHRFEWLHKRIDTQESFDAEVILATVLLDNEPHIYGVVRDISKRKELEEKMTLLNQLVYGSLESADVGAWWVDFTEEDTFHGLQKTAEMIGLEVNSDGDSYKISVWGKILSRYCSDIFRV